MSALREMTEFAGAAREREASAWGELHAIVRHCATLPLALAKSLSELVPEEAGLAELERSVDDLLADLVERAQQEGALRTDVPPREVVRLLSVVVCRPGARADDYLTVVMLDGLRLACEHTVESR